jgi:hypothetical protein
VEDALLFCNLFETTDLLPVMNRAIIDNDKIGIYNGCQRAVELAVQREKKGSK